MDVQLTDGELSLLRELLAAREGGRTVSASACVGGIGRLVTRGYVLERIVNLDTVLYSITATGRFALGCHQART